MSKKILSLLLVIVLIAGCNKQKLYKDNLEGVWEVYKYLLRNVDKTGQFQSQHPNYTITFTKYASFHSYRTTSDST